MCRKVLVFFALFATITSFQIEVKVKQGKLIGSREATVFDKKLYFAFYRVPYAQPPLDKLRFKNPEPVQKWDTPYDATIEFHGACAQAHIVHKHGLYGVEDCLYLNIYTPNIPKPGDDYLKPVVVWLHGYAFAASFSHNHGADFFIDNDLIFVSVTHRIGVFGFLKYNDTDSHANMGLKDIVMALKWIRNNIKIFGGDKRKITLMGNNSAATFISLIMMTEASKLFSKIILQSGSLFSASIFQGNHRLERKRLKLELKKKGLTLSKSPAKTIIQAARLIYTRAEVQNIQRPIVPFTPIIESKSNTSLITQAPDDFYIETDLKKFNKPTLIGFNTQESIAEAMPFIQFPFYLKIFAKKFKFMVPFSKGCRYNMKSAQYYRVAEKIKARYFKGNVTEKSLDNFLKYSSDVIMYPIIKFIRASLNLDSTKMYTYKFDYKGPLNAVKATALGDSNTKVKGVATGDEICYVLKCEPLWEYYVKMNRDEAKFDKSFIKAISELWSNFAKYGDPTPPGYRGNITWPLMTLEGNNVLLIRSELKLTNFKMENSTFDFWDGIYAEFYTDEHCKTKHDEL